jgi:hypothetical protein
MIRKEKWNFENQLEGFPDGFISITSEASQWMIPIQSCELHVS